MTTGAVTWRKRKPWRIETYAQAMRQLRNWPEYIAHRRSRGPENGLFETLAGGLQCHVPARLRYVFQEVVVNDSYELRPLMDKLGPSPLVVDIGANAGYFSLMIAGSIPGAEVHSYEPLPGNFAALERNRALNPEAAARWRVNELAVTGAPVDTVEMYAPAGEVDTGLSSVYAEWNSGATDRVTARAVTFGRILDELAPRTIDLLKLDCEGSEHDILFGTAPEKFARVRRMVMETHTRPFLKTTREDLIAFLHAQGYGTREAVGRKGRNSVVWAER